MLRDYIYSRRHEKLINQLRKINNKYTKLKTEYGASEELEKQFQTLEYQLINDNKVKQDYDIKEYINKELEKQDKDLGGLIQEGVSNTINANFTPIAYNILTLYDSLKGRANLDDLYIKLTKYVDKRFNKLRAYIRTELRNQDKRVKSKKELIGKGVLGCFGVYSFIQGLSTLFNGLFIFNQSFPQRPTEAWINIFLGGGFVFLSYICAHRALTDHWL